ncbi:hypothetical protein PIB30_003453 [Stylosanthes scabra]|uniref:BRCT domain-containing protein n=1 Tax=Stylosanthes scabra TaxID=79078 RepID=A0ABU6U498_9FABA|nr:hypothetical protein [Stylosanthes scabra]
MADASYAISSSSPPGGKFKDADDDSQFQETELFNDTLVLNSPFTEPQVENLNLNTELVEDSDPAENEESGPTCENGGHEVVLDSEDDEMENGSAATVVRGLSDDGTTPTARIPSMRFQKRPVKPPFEQADSNGTSFSKAAIGKKGVSVDTKRFNDDNHLCLPARLNTVHSPELGDSTQAALGFVDQYLSSNDLDLLQGIYHRKPSREKSLHVLSARGSLSLARKIKTQTQNREKEPFRWDVSDQDDKGAGILCRKVNTSSNTGNLYHKEGGHLQSQGICCAGDRCDDENMVQRQGTETKDASNSFKELDVQSSLTRENDTPYSSVIHTEDMSGIGLDTQIAAEAMEALAFMPTTGCHFNDVHQPENAPDGSLSDLIENEGQLKKSSHKQNSGLHSITMKSKKRNVSSCSLSKVTATSSSKHTENLEPNTVLVETRKMMKSKSTIKGQSENKTTSPLYSELVSLEEVCSTEQYTSIQPATKESKNRNKSRRTRKKNQPIPHTERNNNAKKEDDTIRHKRKGADIEADPLKLGIRTKRLHLPANFSGKIGKNSLNDQVEVSPQLSGSSCFLINDTCSWVYPKRARGKRKKAHVQNNLDAPTVLCIDGNKSNVWSTKNIECQNDEDKSCIDNSRCLSQGNSVQPGSADDTMKFESSIEKQPSLLAHVEISANKSSAQSSPEIPTTISSSNDLKMSNNKHTCNEKHNKPCNKRLSKSPLLKELIRLGVSEPTSALVFEDPRQRRDMAFVRVLFSQHLDDSVVKRQKKILARLNISTASSSMDATHFIADKFTRTRNMLEIMALGKLVVTHLWLESCGQANCFIDEKNYILRDVKKEKEIGFRMPVSLAQARQTPLLKGKRVYITPHVKPDKKVVATLVTAVQGQVVDESQVCADKDDKFLDDLLILSCEEDYAICHHFLNRGTAVYSSELLLNGIIIQKLEPERHQLFVDETTGKRPGESNRFGKVYYRRHWRTVTAS